MILNLKLCLAAFLKKPFPWGEGAPILVWLLCRARRPGAPLGCFPISPPKIGFSSNEPGPRRRVTFCMDRKSPKNHQEDAQDGRSAPIFASPWTPFTGAAPEKFSKISGAQGQECLPAFPSGPTGALRGRKFAAGAGPIPRLGLPSQRTRCTLRRRGGCPHPPAKPSPF